ncbi:MAG: HAD family hydrolase, partial [Candidatus Udaeobacter sp.]
MNEGDASPTRVTFLFDVDNTLLDNDRVAADLQRHLVSEIGRKGAQEYWQIFEQLRSDLGYADYLGALQRYRAKHPRAPHLLSVSDFFINYPFAERFFPNAIEVIDHVQQWGPAVILSDGDVVFQPLKIGRSGLANAVAGRVLIYVHKEQELENVQQRYPAEHYVLIDDKLRILAAVKKTWSTRVTTVFVRQGHYAVDPEIVANYPPADISI